MRTVTGPTSHVVVVGAGLSGLAAALHLAGAGREVTVLEREDIPGGRAGRLEVDGYSFDTGPTVLTMPDLVQEALDAVGERLEDWLTLDRLDPAYRAYYPDGSTLDVRSSTDDMADEIARVCGSAEAAGYRRFVTFVTELYDVEMKHFIDRNLDSPFDLARPSLARLAALGGFRKLAPKVGSYLKDERTRRLLSFQAMYAGLSPYDALAIYAVIAYMDSVAGVYAPVGGMHALPKALAGAAEKHGVTFRYGTTVTRVELSGDRAVAVHTADGDRIACDTVVLTPDLPVAYRMLLPPEVTPRGLKRLVYSPSCFLLLAGSSASYSKIAHHNIHFGKGWRSVFDDIIDNGSLMKDPSFLVTNPTMSDPTLAPDGKQVYYVLFPTPNLDADIDWSVVGPRYRDECVAVLERSGYVGFGDAIEVENTTTPADWALRGMERGAPFAASHTFTQTGPFRPKNLAPGLQNVVFAGSGTTPGVGVPMVLISGRLAAERIIGA
ncbi:phytoene desaturase family protein [Acidothermaceae bacterium B102]|nr:phytoene desaturase family protein [Acidothermaceae bacterium B102]